MQRSSPDSRLYREDLKMHLQQSRLHVLLSAALLGLTRLAVAGDAPETMSIGPWSDVVDGIRGRLVIAPGEVLAEGKLPETVAYLELENKRPKAATNLYFDPLVKCEVRDLAGKIVPQKGTGGDGGGGARPQPAWLKLPFDSRIRLRLSPYGLGTEDGLRINIGSTEWNIKAADRGEYFLS